MSQQLLDEFEKLSRDGHQYHPGEWRNCSYSFCHRRFTLLEQARATSSNAVTLRYLDTVIDGVDERKIVAIENGEFLGCVGLQYSHRRVAGFRQLFVREDRRGRGIGKKLVSRCVALAQSAGCRTMGAIVAKENADVLPFYEKLGFIAAYEYEEDGSVIIVKVLN